MVCSSVTLKGDYSIDDHLIPKDDIIVENIRLDGPLVVGQETSISVDVKNGSNKDGVVRIFFNRNKQLDVSIGHGEIKTFSHNFTPQNTSEMEIGIGVTALGGRGPVFGQTRIVEPFDGPPGCKHKGVDRTDYQYNGEDNFSFDVWKHCHFSTDTFQDITPKGQGTELLVPPNEQTNGDMKRRNIALAGVVGVGALAAYSQRKNK
jgi:hypothetical protein